MDFRRKKADGCMGGIRTASFGDAVGVLPVSGKMFQHLLAQETAVEVRLCEVEEVEVRDCEDDEVRDWASSIGAEAVIAIATRDAVISVVIFFMV